MLDELFALAREASERVLGTRPFDEQIVGNFAIRLQQERNHQELPQNEADADPDDRRRVEDHREADPPEEERRNRAAEESRDNARQDERDSDQSTCR